MPAVLGWEDPGASFTAVAQLGTVAAVIVAFRADLVTVSHAALNGFARRDARSTAGFRLARQIVIGTAPIAVLGIGASELVDGPLRNLVVVAVALVAGSVWLWSSTRRPGTHRVEDAMDRDALLIGFAQAAALVPGVSRSGATIGAAYRLGFSPSAAARYSFLLSIPAVTLAGVFGLRDVEGSLPLGPTLIAVGVAFVSGVLSIRWLLSLIAFGRFGGLVTYRLLVAAGVVMLVFR